MKFVIYKGIRGFCDRLQSLLYVIQYAKQTGRILVIDWRDKDWCHNKEKDFSHYFYLEGINHLPLISFFILYNILLKENIKLSIYPKAWENDFFLEPENIYDKSFLLLNDSNDILFNIIDKKIPDFEYDIVIYSNTGIRYLYYSLFYEHFRIQKFILERIYEHNFYKEIVNNQKQYICVHLRGGDRMVADDNTIPGLFNNSYNIESYLDDIEKKIDFNLSHVLVISDTEILINRFIERNKYRNVKLHTTNNYKPDEWNKSIHQINKEETKISKEEINIQMITDFYFFIKANQKIGDGVSYFSNFATNLILNE